MVMKRNHYTPEQEQFRDAFRRFLEREVVPHSPRFREQGMIDRDVYRKAGEGGFLCYWVEEAYGGLGLADFRYDQLMYEEVTRSHETGLWMGALNRNSPPYIAKYGTEAQKHHFLPKLVSGEMICAIAMTEPDAGSDIAGFKTHARPRGDGSWVLNGQKTYISYGLTADLFVVAAKTDPSNPRQLGLFLVEKGMPGFRPGRKLEKLGFLSQDTSELFFEDVELSPQHVIGDPARGFDYMRGGLAEERRNYAPMSIAPRPFSTIASTCSTRANWTRRRPPPASSNAPKYRQGPSMSRCNFMDLPVTCRNIRSAGSMPTRASRGFSRARPKS